jgi:hypothetical protein
MKWVLLGTILLGWSLSAAAGNEAGNGGYTVQCDHLSPDGYSIEVLDYHEIRVRFPPRTFTIDLGSQGDEWARVRYALQRLARLDPNRAAVYQDKADHFLENANLVPHANLPDPGDSGPTYLEVGCRAIPTVIQYHGHVEEQKLYTVNEDLYDALSPNHRAGLILHEIIYGEAIEHGAQNSQDSRYVNALISSAEIAKMSPSDYEQRMVAVGFDSSPGPQHPVWFSNPISLPDAMAGIAYQQDLRKSVSYSGSARLIFSLVQAPSWLNVSSDGLLSGTPTQADVGATSFTVAVGDGTDGVPIAQVQINVNPSFSVAWSKNPIDLGLVEPGNVFSADLSPFAVSDTGSTITFSVSGAPGWLSLSASGVLTGTAGTGDIGSYAFEVTATDSSGNRATVKVELAVGAATWSFAVTQGTSFVVDLNQPQYVGSDAGSALVFSLVSAPSFVSLTAAGTLSVSATSSDIGAHSMTVRVTKGETVTVRTLTIQVGRSTTP